MSYKLLVKDEKGSVLILTFIIMITLTAITVGFLNMTSTRLRGSAYDVASSKALWLAEAGLQDVIYRLKNDSGYRNSPTAVNANLGDGSYSVSVSKNGNIYTLTSTGTVDALNRKTTQSMVVAEGTPETFSYAQHAGGNINFKNSEGTINGDISAGGQVKNEDNMTINDTITEGSSVVTPSVDFDSYLTIADNVVNGNKTFEEGQTYSGIWYVDGKAIIEDDVTINGSIIATGNIKMQNSEGITISPDSGYPALVSGNKIKGKELEDSTINGLIYAVDNINLNQNEDNAFNGTLIASGKILMKNGENFTVTYDSDIQSNPPPYFSGGGAITVTPQRDWNEIIPAT